MKENKGLHETNIHILQTAEKVFEQMNIYGAKSKPFLFGIDFDVKYGFFVEPDKASESGIYFNINGFGNESAQFAKNDPIKLIKYPVSLKQCLIRPAHDSAGQYSPCSRKIHARNQSTLSTTLSDDVPGWLVCTVPPCALAKFQFRSHPI